jgi:hypothetical protein
MEGKEMKRYRILHEDVVWGQFDDLGSAMRALIQAWEQFGTSYILYDYSIDPPREIRPMLHVKPMSESIDKLKKAIDPLLREIARHVDECDDVKKVEVAFTNLDDRTEIEVVIIPMEESDETISNHSQS